MVYPRYASADEGATVSDIAKAPPDVPFPYDLAEGLPVPLAISAMLAVEILRARDDAERSRIVHRYAHHIAEAIDGPSRSHITLPAREL